MGLGSWGEELQGFLGGLYGSDYVRDFHHAAKTFRTNFYQNAPKFKFTFHVVFEINDEAWPDSIGAGQNFGLLVKDIQLPTYKMDVKEYNQYNRKRLVQTKINYEPVEVTFHDDNASLITSMWHAYYTYYYADSRNPQIEFNDSPGAGAIGQLPALTLPSIQPNVGYNGRNIYDVGLEGQLNWGYIGEPTSANPDLRKPAFFKNITIFGFAQHNFVAYTLVNPMIRSFGHDKYNYDDSQTTMKNSMNLDYETVVYNVGYLNGLAPDEIIKGFGDSATYDRTPSPITLPGANGRATGQGGYLNAISTGLKQIEQGNFAAGLYNLYGGYRAQKGRNILDDMRQEFKQGLKEGFNPYPIENRNTPFWTPGISQTPTVVGQAGGPTVGVVQPNPVNYILPSEPIAPPIPPDELEFFPTIQPVEDFIPIALPAVLPSNPAPAPREVVAGIQINKTIQADSQILDNLPYYVKTDENERFNSNFL